MSDTDRTEITQHTPAGESPSDTAPLSADAQPIAHPERIGRYRVEEVLGRGGFGLVYLAHDEQLDRRVAVKVPHAKLIARPEDAAAYLTEARTVANLDHPGIVPVHDVGSTEDYPCYVVSKYIEGGDLSARIQASRPDARESAGIVATVAEALHYAHTQGLVHRDVKPGNLLIDEAGRPYVVDFGLALREEDRGTGPVYAGTPAYMSPEQARGEGHRVDGRSDIFSLGAVFYRLLTGKQTFSGVSITETLEQIAVQEPRPPRQIEDSIPRELERICLKSLSKRASERYSTALDMAEDLRAFLAEDPGLPQKKREPADTETVLGSTQIQVAAAGSDADSQLIRIVPKGLRSFDAHDADFFLELLPGARDRTGLPDSLRFWKTRIEETDPDDTFSVGLIYGPSGCGKSSLVKAGLLPRLSENVISVYVEATPDETESRLLHGLRKHCPGLPENLSLKDIVAALRRGEGNPAGQKVLIVLDQFEQWLHANRDNEDTDLVQALRQCDGGRVQCIAMVRDDFWLAATRFMGELEVELLQGQNTALADLFDLVHARKVLAAFGRAFGRLPASDTTKEQKDFLKQSVTGLAEDGKVICVRLALFAEMMKGKEWTPAILRDVGGTEGIGTTFLEETFSAQTAHPEHRLHQKAARAVLKDLLPDSGTDIKGYMRSHAELLEASGYGSRPKDFDDLIRILDSEIRLITPTDPEGKDADDDSVSHVAAGQKYYQLTHDYLVHSLRDWLTRKQKETRRGRAELRLADRAALWNAKPENRHLPAWWEYANIRLFTDRKNWSQPQRMMMQRAARIHGVRWGSVGLFVIVFSITTSQIVHSSRQSILRERTATAVTAMIIARGILVPRAIDDLTDFPREMVLTELQEQFESADEVRKLPLAYALAHFGDVRIKFLVSQVEGVSPDEVANVVVALDRSRTDAVAALKAAARVAESDEHWRHKARLAMLALQLKSPALAEEMCRLQQANPIHRTWFIEECSTWHGDLSKLPQAVADSRNVSLRSGVILAVGSVPVTDVLIPEQQAWEPVLGDWYAAAPDTPTHSAAGRALRMWKLDVPEIPPTRSPTAGMNWHVNGAGMTMLRIPAGSFVRRDMGADALDQTVTLTRSFLLADGEVTRDQFQQFMDDPERPDTEKPTGDWPGARVEYSPTEQHPVQQMSWYDALLYCNWLSRKEGLTPSYERTGEQETITASGRSKDHDAWRFLPEANGYRLPSEAEWEYACRAGTGTTFSHGADESLLDRYAVYREGRTELPGSKLPNGRGLFDIHGNVQEWCYDWYGEFGSENNVTNPLGPSQGSARVLRGGAFLTFEFALHSANRNHGPPDIRNGDSIGFRVARTYP